MPATNLVRMWAIVNVVALDFPAPERDRPGAKFANLTKRQKEK